MSILITDDATIGDLRVLVDALGDGWSLDWTDTGIELVRDTTPAWDTTTTANVVSISTTEPATIAERVNAEHRCTLCGKTFAKPHGLEVHHRRTHGPKAVARPVDQDAARARAAEAL